MHDDLADELELVETQIEIAHLAADLDSGLVPPHARRSRFPHEVVAQVNFAAIDASVDQFAGEVTAILSRSRDDFLALLRTDLERQTTAEAVRRRLAELRVNGVNSINGADALIASTQRELLPLLERARDEGAGRVRSEARAQLVSTPTTTPQPITSTGALDDQAYRLATAPHADLIRAAADAAMSAEIVGRPAASLADDVVRQMGGLSVSQLELEARRATQSLEGLGRQDEFLSIAQPAVIYASELNDSNTCGPCSMVDGREYESLAEARVDYPNGIYRRCEGGLNCRGILVFVWPTETPSQRLTPGDRR